MLSLFSEKLPLKNLAYTHRKKVRKNACTLFYFKIKKKKTTLYIFYSACIWNVKKEKWIIIVNSLWGKN